MSGRVAHVLVTCTEVAGDLGDEDDVSVTIQRVGGEGNGWATTLVAGMLAGDDGELTNVELS